MADLHTVRITIDAKFQNGVPFDGVLRLKLSRAVNVADGGGVVVPREWQEVKIRADKPETAAVELIPNELLGEGTFYHYELVQVANTGAYQFDRYGKRRVAEKGAIVVPDRNCNISELITLPPTDEMRETAEAFASEAKQMAALAKTASTVAIEEAEKSENAAVRAEAAAKKAETAGGGGGGSSVDVVAPSPEGEGKAADAKAVYEEIKGIYDNISDLEAADTKFEDKLLKKVDKLTNPPNGIVYPSEVNLENGGFYLLGANESDICNAYLPVVDTFEPQTFIIYCRNGTSTRFKDRLGRSILTNLDGSVYSGGTINLRIMGFPTQKFKTVTMRKIKDDNGDELIHLEVI